MELTQMTWPEVKALVEQHPICLIPTGATEQHGPHLPLSVDADLSMAVCRGVASAIGTEVPVLITPAVWLGLSTHHLQFAGTVSASPSTFLSTISELVTGLAANGLRRFLIVNGHGGNGELVRLAARTLAERSGLTVGAANYWQMALPMDGLYDEWNTVGVGHAGEFETSLMMYLHPASVRTDQIVNHPIQWLSGAARDLLQDRRILVRGTAVGVDKRNHLGVNGDPTSASAKKGERIFSKCVEGVSEIVRRLAAA